MKNINGCIESAAFIAGGVLALDYMGVKAPIMHKAGYSALTFLAGKFTYAIADATINAAPFKTTGVLPGTSIGLEKIISVAKIGLSLLGSAYAGTYLPGGFAGNLTLAFTVSLIAFMPGLFLQTTALTIKNYLFEPSITPA